MNPLRVYTMLGCVKCYQVKQYLSAKHISFQEINVTEVPEAVEDVMDRIGEFILPIIVYKDQVFKPEFDASNNPVIDLNLNNLRANEKSR